MSKDSPRKRVKSGEAPKQHVAVRLSEEDLAKINAIVAMLANEWSRVSRSDVLRMLFHKGMVVFEKEMAERDGPDTEP